MALRFEHFTVLDSLVDAALVIGTSGEVHYCNEALSKICEIPFKQLSRKKTLGQILNFMPSDILEAERLKTLEDQSPYEEVAYISTSGKTGKVQISVQPILNAAGEKNILVFLHDVTLEERLQAKYRSELFQKDAKIDDISLLLEVSNALTGISDTSTVYKNVAAKLLAHGICESVIHLQYHENSPTSPMTLYVAGEECNSQELSKKVLMPFKNLWETRTFQHLTLDANPDFYKFFASKINMGKDTCVKLLPIHTAKFRTGVFMLVMNPDQQKVDAGHEDLLKSIVLQMGVALESALFFESSITDDMTKLFNKRYLMTRLNTEIERAKRNIEPLSFVIFDVDHFKQFNDKYGHQTGDLVLKEVARVTKNFCRAYDVAARYGGEEFVLILPKTDEAGAIYLAERLRKKIEEITLSWKNETLKVTVSLGASVMPIHAADADELISLADKALYFAKRTGRNRFKIYSPDCEITLAAS